MYTYTAIKSAPDICCIFLIFEAITELSPEIFLDTVPIIAFEI